MITICDCAATRSGSRAAVSSVGCAKLLRRHPPTVARHLPPLDTRTSACCIDDLDIFGDAVDTIPAHVDAIAGPCPAICGRLFKTDAPHLMLPAIIELDGHVGGCLGIVTIAIGCPADLDQAS